MVRLELKSHGHTKVLSQPTTHTHSMEIHTAAGQINEENRQFVVLFS